jgi:DnaJ-class molecular chaperone
VTDLACEPCKGSGKVKGPCTTCDGRGYIVLTQAFYACHDCGNHRCVKCGGSGQRPVPRLMPKVTP